MNNILIYMYIPFVFSGDVMITDISNAVDVTRRKVDSAGALAVRYTQGGMVVTLGQSNSGQILLWDPRVSPSNGKVELQTYNRPLVNNSQGLGVVDKNSYLTCLETHPSNEYEFYCGTSTGKQFLLVSLLSNVLYRSTF